MASNDLQAGSHTFVSVRSVEERSTDPYRYPNWADLEEPSLESDPDEVVVWQGWVKCINASGEDVWRIDNPTLVVQTNSRLALLCHDYNRVEVRKGATAFGVGASVMRMGVKSLQAASRKLQRSGLFASGAVSYDWPRIVQSTEAGVGTRKSSRLVTLLCDREGSNEGAALTLHLPPEHDAKAFGQQLARRIASYRLEKCRDRLDDEDVRVLTMVATEADPGVVTVERKSKLGSLQQNTIPLLGAKPMSLPA